jgi:mono/diheme cytochrome c family protein
MEDTNVTWTRWTAVGLAIVTLAAGAASLSCTGTPSSNTAAVATAEDPVARGARIVFTSGCVDCHTPGSFYGAPDTTRMLSGSELGWNGPWGISFPRNLTPDSTTGIGTWTEDQIVTAVREGRRPDGTMLLPPMPWPVYSHLTDEDVHALAKYLKSIPPVVHQMPKQVPPGGKTNLPTFVLPGPPAWDAQNMPPPAAAAASGK